MAKRETRPTKRSSSPEAPAERAPLDDAPEAPLHRGWIVVLGSSAGGLAALQEFLGHLPTAEGCALIVAQHLDPERASALVEILARATTIPVLEASDGVPLASGAIYVVPPNVQATVRGGVLRLGSTAQQPSRHSIDRLLTSVAQDAGEHAVAVILSGTGSDGSEGTEAVRQMGGMTFAQTEESAQFADMPRHAVETGCVDRVLGPAAIAKELNRLTHAESIRRLPSPADPPAEHDPIDVGRALDLVQSVTGLDLGCMNASHVERRIARRALLSGLAHPAEYLALLAVSPAEVVNLKSDLLIGVTSFFRDPDAYAALRERAFPLLVDRRDPGDTIRIWVPGCATGEEVFSLGMALADFCEERRTRVQFQIFGTDLNDAAIAASRAAVYREAALDGLPAGYASRFFKRVEHGFQIGRDLRERCVFAVHNVFTDPPLSRLDLISCRNLLIYAAPPFQQRLLSTFHFALKPGGVLFLGASESVGSGSDLFVTLDRRQRLFSRKSGPSQLPARRGRRPLEPITAGLRAFDSPQRVTQDANRPSDAVEDALLDHFAPKDFVVVDREFQILRFHGKVGRFLAPATGQASLNLLRLVDEDLALDLRVLLHQASVPGAGETRRSVVFRGAGREPSRITIQAVPVPPHDESDGLVVVAFWPEPDAPAAQASEEPAAEPGGAAARANDLAEELTLTRELLRQVVDDQEVVRDDVNTANVELQSTNEELQTTIEELETAKEELQATNEELHTVNQELQVRNQELNQLNADLGNLLSSSEIPIVMLDGDLRVRRFTPSAVTLLRLSPQDVGRDIRDLRTSPDLDEVLPLLRDVLAGRDAPAVELHARDGRWYSARLLPYLDAENRIDGVVMALVDVDAMRRSLAVATESRDYARAVIDTVRSPLLELDAGLRVRMANPSFHETFATTPEKVVGHSLLELADGTGVDVRAQLATLLTDGREIRDLEIDLGPDASPARKLVCDAREVRGGSAGDRRILVSVRDVTAERTLAQALRERGEALAAADRAKDAFLAQLSHELRTPLAAIIGWSQHILEGNLPADEHLAAMQSILRNALAQLQLVGDLLDVSRALNGNLTVTMQPVSLRKVLAEARDAVAPAARTKSVTIELLAPAGQPDVTADPDRMRQVVVNLLTNAVHFTPERGRIRVKLRATRTEQVVTVTDNGAGITAEHLPHVFERYYQAAPDGKTGLGLGLSLVHDIVTLHGGRVTAASAGPGKGSTFTVHLPLAPGSTRTAQ